MEIIFFPAFMVIPFYPSLYSYKNPFPSNFRLSVAACKPFKISLNTTLAYLKFALVSERCKKPYRKDLVFW